MARAPPRPLHQLIRRALASRPPPRSSAPRGRPASIETERPPKDMDDVLTLLRPVAVPPRRPSAATAAADAALAAAYSAHCRADLLRRQTTAELFLRAKWAAVDALPLRRRAEALEVDPTPQDVGRWMWTETPPVKGYKGPGGGED